MRLIDVDVADRCFWVSFPYDKRCAEAVRLVSGAQFDQASRRWKVPIESVDALLSALDPLHFKFTPAMRTWQDAPMRPVEVPVQSIDVQPDVFTISTLNQRVLRAVRSAFPSPVWVDCEVEGINRARPGGHAFFELVEKNGEKTISRVSAVIHVQDRPKIVKALESVGVNLEDGLVLRLQVRPDVYVPGGALQVAVLDVDLKSLQESVERNREKILKQLLKEGQLDANSRRALPLCPLRVGVITSINSDAMHDFVDELRRSHYAFDVTVYGAVMQGMQMEASILRGLSYFAERSQSFDVLVIIRGGGARTDLAWFDSFRLGLAVMRHPLRILTGIGHHRDQSVLDHVSWACKTPTAVANALVAHTDRFVGRLEQVSHRLQNILGQKVTSQMRKMDQLEFRMRHAAEKSLNRSSLVLEQRFERLERGVVRRLECIDNDIEKLSARVISSDPRHALKRGFVMVRAKQGVIRSAQGVRAGDVVTLEFYDGEIRAKVEGS